MNGTVIYEVAIWLVPLVIAIVFHEVAHGLVAPAPRRSDGRRSAGG